MDIGPPGCRPGDLVFITDTSTAEDGVKRSWVTFEPLTEDVTQEAIEVHLGYAYPIHYKVWITAHIPSGELVSQVVLYEIGSWKYTVTVEGIHTSDESDELSAADELQVVSMVSADLDIYAHDSQEYDNVDAGEFRPVDVSDKYLQSKTGLPVEVKEWLAVTVRLYEIDSMPVHGSSTNWTVADGVFALSEAASKTRTGFGELAGAVLLVLGIAVDTWLEGDGDANFLGQQERAWSPVDLLQRMIPGTNYFFEDLPFQNSDDEGSHTLKLRITQF